MRKLILFVFVLLMPSVLALGISPGRTTVDFVPGLERDVTFSVVNEGNKDMNIVVAVQGELAEYVTILEPNFRLLAGQANKPVTYRIKLPNDLSPGLHTAEIVVLQLPEEGQVGEAFIGAALAVITQLHVNVIFPGKFADVSLHIIGPENDGTVNFVIPVTSRGEFDLVNVKADIEIYTSLNEKVKTLSTDQISVQSGHRKELTAQWDGKAPAGPYRAVATVFFDEKSETVEKEFTIGSRKLEIESIEVNNFRLGEIAKFEILVKNEWSDSIRGAFLEMNIFDDRGRVLAEVKTPTHDIDPLEKTLLIGFWDTAGVKEDVYDADLTLFYLDSEDSRDLQLDVKKDKITVVAFGYIFSQADDGGGLSGGLLTTLISVIIVLVIVNLSWFMYLRKRLKK